MAHSSWHNRPRASHNLVALCGPPEPAQSTLRTDRQHDVAADVSRRILSTPNRVPTEVGGYSGMRYSSYPLSAAATAGGKISPTSPSNRSVTSRKSSCSVGPRLMITYGTPRLAASSGMFAAG